MWCVSSTVEILGPYLAYYSLLAILKVNVGRHPGSVISDPRPPWHYIVQTTQLLKKCYGDLIFGWPMKTPYKQTTRSFLDKDGENPPNANPSCTL